MIFLFVSQNKRNTFNINKFKKKKKRQGFPYRGMQANKGEKQSDTITNTILWEVQSYFKKFQELF